MQTEEESFIVLEETPSMLQFSLLNSPDYHTEKSSLYDTHCSIGSDIQKSNKTHMKIDKNLQDVENYLSSVSLGSSSTNDQVSPRTTLAQSFLLGDINCDKLKVIKYCIYNVANQIKRIIIFTLTELFSQFELFKRKGRYWEMEKFTTRTQWFKR